MAGAFAEQLRRWRQAYSLDLDTLAKYGPMTAQHLEQIEAGSAPNLAQLLHPLGYTLGRASQKLTTQGDTNSADQIAACLDPGSAAVFMAGFALGHQRRPHGPNNHGDNETTSGHG